MNLEIKHIIEGEQKPVLLTDDSGNAAREKVEVYCAAINGITGSEFKYLAVKCNYMTELNFSDIKGEMDREFKEMRMKREHLLNEKGLMNKNNRGDSSSNT